MNAFPSLGPLFTDLYELTMAAGYHARGLEALATFSLFIRKSAHRNFFAAAGLEDTLREIEALRFSGSDIAYLRQGGLFSDDFLAYLEGFRFSGTVRAMAEGTIFFPDEPILEVTAPIIEAQILETFLINMIGFQTLIASKAARCVHSSRGRTLIDFSLRRTQARDAGMMVARSTYIAGFAATSNMLAGKCYGIPTAGTMAHSFVGAFDNEVAAFAAYAKSFPDNSVFLIDTYDTLQGAQNAVKVALEMRRRGKNLVGVRLDSGDMADLSVRVRRILDDAGMTDVKIFASGNFDEFKIIDVLKKGAPIDAFGVGTKIGVSADAPYLNVVYKMVRYDRRNIRKLSAGKATLAGEKQVFRIFDEKGRYLKDVIGTRNESIQGAEPLLKTVMRDGKCLGDHPAIDEIRNKFKKNFCLLDERYKSLEKGPDYPVGISFLLGALQKGA